MPITPITFACSVMKATDDPYMGCGDIAQWPGSAGAWHVGEMLISTHRLTANAK
jgi:hypothetical protein